METSGMGQGVALGGGGGLVMGPPRGAARAACSASPEAEAAGEPVLRRVIIKKLLERQEMERRLSGLRKEPIGA